MNAIETQTIEQDGQTFRIAIYPDADTPNPLDDWCEMGSILSLNRRDGNFDPGGIEAAIAHNPDTVPLSYFEHGLCLWSVAGELSASARCTWDSVPFAGIWLPDAETLASSAHYGGRTRRLFMRKRARQACDAYTLWCNGDIYGYEVHRIAPCDGCGGERSKLIDSCWGFYGLETCLGEARTVIGAQAAALAA